MAVFGILRQRRAQNGCADCARHENDDRDEQKDNDDDGGSEHTRNVAESTDLARGDDAPRRQLCHGGAIRRPQCLAGWKCR